jgi:uncharacterized protein YecT (DUF1311 family)
MKAFSVLCLLIGSASSYSATPDCENPPADREHGCAFIQSTLANLELARYFQAARETLRLDNESLTSLNSAQSDWEASREQHCRTVTDPLVPHSWGAQYNICRMDLARNRTHEIWSTYLKAQDETPPVLPEPKR